MRNRKDLTLLAMYLHEADIMSSAGVSYERTQCETIQFKQERGEGAARPSDVLEFLIRSAAADFNAGRKGAGAKAL